MKPMRTLQNGLFSLLAVAALSVQAEPAIIFDMGGKFDKAFNQAAYTVSSAGKGNRQKLSRV